MAKLHDKLPGSRFVTLPGAGHISNMDRAAEFNQALRDFLTKAWSRKARPWT
jgi:pimeloyl-ACP methyl ester carboxylesterase